MATIRAMIIAYALSTEDNDSQMYWDQGVPGAPVCPACGLILDDRFVNPRFELAQRRYDLSETVDGFLIASKRFKAFCEAERYSDMEFVPLPSAPGFFLLLVNAVHPVDRARSEIELLDPCPTCGEHDEVIGGFRIFLRDMTQALPDGFWRSDLKTGSQKMRSYTYFCGVETRRKLLERKLRGLFFDEVDT